MRAVFATTAAIAISLAAPARADDASNAATARSLFVAARDLMKDGAWEDARAKLEEAYALSPGKGILFNLALCLENTGRVASAWERYLEVASAERRAGDEERARIARERADAIASRVPHLRVHVRDATASVARDGTPLPPAAWDTLLPIDPGKHVITSTAPERVPWSEEVTIGEGESREIDVPPLAPKPPPLVVVRREKPPVLVAVPDKAWRTVAGVGVITGAVSIAAAGVMTGLAVGSWNAADPECDASGCSKRGFDLRNDSLTYGDVATAFFVAGVVLGVAGTILWFVAPRTHRRVVVDAAGIRATF